MATEHGVKPTDESEEEQHDQLALLLTTRPLLDYMLPQAPALKIDASLRGTFEKPDALAALLLDRQ